MCWIVELFGPTHRSSKPAQKVAQADQIKRSSTSAFPDRLLPLRAQLPASFLRTGRSDMHNQWLLSGALLGGIPPSLPMATQT